MTDVLVVNKSTLVTDKEVAAMVRAVSVQVHQHAAPALGVKPVGVHHAANESEASPGDWVIGIMDDGDQAGVLGWHTQENDVIYGRVFARPSLTDGHSTALTGPYAVSSVLSHEVLETLGDPHVNQWAELANGLLIAYELCDPVESDTYTVHDQHAGDVTVSDFVTPEWFDPQRSPGEKFDYLGRATAPGTLTKGGYWVQATIGNETQKFGAVIPTGADVQEFADRGVTYVFGPDYPDWKKALKTAGLGRTARRTGEGATA